METRHCRMHAMPVDLLGLLWLILILHCVWKMKSEFFEVQQGENAKVRSSHLTESASDGGHVAGSKRIRAQS